MTHERDRIHSYIAAHPGEHFNALVRALDLAPGQVQYHLKKLKRQERVVEQPIYGRTHYFTPEHDASDRKSIAVVRRETARDVLFFLLETESSRPGAVADELDIARSTLEWHLDHMVEQDLVEKQRNRNNRVTLVVCDQERTVRLLEAVTPSFSDRMLDRFTRLVDNLVMD